MNEKTGKTMLQSKNESAREEKQKVIIKSKLGRGGVAWGVVKENLQKDKRKGGGWVLPLYPKFSTSLSIKISGQKKVAKAAACDCKTFAI